MGSFERDCGGVASRRLLGQILDRSLIYKSHLEITGQKLKARHNTIRKLTGTTWSTQAAAFPLVYPTAEYCAPIWLGSRHISKIDVHLNVSMRIIADILKSTPVRWLHVTSNIASRELRRQEAIVKEWKRMISLIFRDLPVHNVLTNIANVRLKSRKPMWDIPYLKQLNDCNILKENLEIID
ncbi:hypothetical protein Trydic_g16660 [Trypoxylus dichotomus]